ncbi:transcription termination/antitermination protein NusA, partial [Candidatus Berkelbacteria bacterium CG_4_8_14_3_um_filter_33_6]
QEKIDIILWDDDPKNLIVNSMSPAEIEKVKLSNKEKRATVIVPEDQLSLAIGKNGQNVRLASRISGYEIDIPKDNIKSKKKEIPVTQKPEAKETELKKLSDKNKQKKVFTKDKAEKKEK